MRGISGAHHEGRLQRGGQWREFQSRGEEAWKGPACLVHAHKAHATGGGRRLVFAKRPDLRVTRGRRVRKRKAQSNGNGEGSSQLSPHREGRVSQVGQPVLGRGPQRALRCREHGAGTGGGQSATQRVHGLKYRKLRRPPPAALISVVRPSSSPSTALVGLAVPGCIPQQVGLQQAARRPADQAFEGQPPVGRGCGQCRRRRGRGLLPILVARRGQAVAVLPCYAQPVALLPSPPGPGRGRRWRRLPGRRRGRKKAGPEQLLDVGCAAAVVRDQQQPARRAGRALQELRFSPLLGGILDGM